MTIVLNDKDWNPHKSIIELTPKLEAFKDGILYDWDGQREQFLTKLK